ncbi:hypothetical protein NQ318_013601 [Aromia moschata]|uniref:Chaperone DnaJ C-terminal domain-containing protein n=1 Tax=Aromia moschata TaxID=1265417 RepID=A0AAV8YMN6_9CUCU|nr:hypothetical protein NQ318_013601 [Aromia moschata]
MEAQETSPTLTTEILGLRSRSSSGTPAHSLPSSTSVIIECSACTMMTWTSTIPSHPSVVDNSEALAPAVPSVANRSTSTIAPTETKTKSRIQLSRHDLYVSLDDITKGCQKKMKISRKVLQPDGTTRKEDKVLTINVKPGWKAGTKITFQREGDQGRNKIPADIVFIIRDKPHPLFKREGSDIRYTAKISLKQDFGNV